MIEISTAEFTRISAGKRLSAELETEERSTTGA